MNEILGVGQKRDEPTYIIIRKGNNEIKITADRFYTTHMPEMNFNREQLISRFSAVGYVPSGDQVEIDIKITRNYRYEAEQYY